MISIISSKCSCHSIVGLLCELKRHLGRDDLREFRKILHEILKICSACCISDCKKNEDNVNLIMQCIVDVGWFTRACFQAGRVEPILKVLAAEASLFIHYTSMWINIHIHIACSILQETTARESLFYVAVLLTYMRDILKRSPAICNSKLMPPIEKEILNQLRVSKVCSRNTASCRVFVVFSCVRLLYTVRRAHPLSLTLCTLLSTLYTLPTPSKAVAATSDVRSVYGRASAIEYRVGRALGGLGVGETGDSKLSTMSMRCSLDKQSGDTLTDFTLFNCNASALLVSNMHNYVTVASETLPAACDLTLGSNDSGNKSGADRDMLWVFQEFEAWSVDMNKYHSISSAVWQRIITWIHREKWMRRLLQKNIIETMSRNFLHICSFSSANNATPCLSEIAAQSLKSIWLISLQPIPPQFLMTLLRTGSAILASAVHSCVHALNAGVISNERTSDHVRMVVAACHMTTSIAAHIESSNPQVVLVPLFTLLESVLDIRTSVVEWSSPTVDCDARTTEITYVQLIMDAVCSHMGYIMLHGHEVVRQNLESVYGGNRLHSILMLVFDDMWNGEPDDESVSGNYTILQHSVLLHMPPLLAALLHTFIAPRLGVVCSLDVSKCRGDDFSLQTLDLTALWKRFPCIALTLRDQMRQWPVDTSRASNLKIPQFHELLMQLSGKALRDYVSALMSTRIRDVNPEPHRVHEHQIPRKTSAHRALMIHDVCVMIMSYLSVKRICRLTCTNTYFAAAGQNEQLWKQKYDKHGPLKFHEYPATSSGTCIVCENIALEIINTSIHDAVYSRF